MWAHGDIVETPSGFRLMCITPMGADGKGERWVNHFGSIQPLPKDAVLILPSRLFGLDRDLDGMVD